MSSYNKFVLTNEGAELLAVLMSSEGELEFRRMTVGAGIYSEEEQKIESIRSMTSLKDERQQTYFSSIKKVGNMVELKASFNNQNVTEEYSMTEVGIYAGKRGTESSILYCVSLREGKADIMPDFSSGKIHDVIFLAKVGIGDTVNPTIIYSRDVYALSEDLALHVSDRSNPHGTNKEQVGLGEVNNTSDMDKPVSTAQQTALDTYYQQSTGYTDTKIAQLINGAPSTLDTLGEIAEAMKENESVVGALEAAIGTKANQTEMESLLGTKLDKSGDSKDNFVTFTSGDNVNPTSWSEIDLVKSKEKHGSLMQKFTLAVKNLRYMWNMLGSTDISAIGNGTVTGAINELNTGMNQYVRYTVTIDNDYQYVQITACKNSNHLILQGAGQLKDVSSWTVNGMISTQGVLGTIDAGGNYLKLPTATVIGKNITNAQRMDNWLLWIQGSATASPYPSTNAQLYMAYANGKYYICWASYEFTVQNNMEFMLNAVIPINIIS